MSRFIDEVEISVHSGKGGRGAVSFRRERYVPKGGPDGGDGGRGGDVILRVDRGLRTLYHLKLKSSITAADGMPGSGRRRHGADGAHSFAPVPPGTVVMDPATGKTLADLTHEGDEYVAVRGGRGGRGNARFSSATNQAPRYAQSGEQGEGMVLLLHIKVIADVGLVGLPNAGKSTLLSVLTNAKPKVADYPFTTLTPNLGVLKYGNQSEYIIADIPGLIAGASSGLGLGIRFLKHIERTRVLLFLIDLNEDAYEEHYQTLIQELRSYSPVLLDKPRIVVGNKIDTVDSERVNQFFHSNIGGKKLVISAVTRQGLRELQDEIAALSGAVYET
jgi:GTP-binding protein